ncbi:MAG TPA: hypothetical protein VKS79_10030 [Gemmataceae bacterium]|nr:hypothetical protein [Gemmataceae bacterium]
MARHRISIFGFLILVLFLVPTLPARADESKGKVKSVNGDKSQFVMTDTTGRDITVHLKKDGKVLVNEKAAKITDLQAGDLVIVSCNSVGNEPLEASEVRATRQGK